MRIQSDVKRHLLAAATCLAMGAIATVSVSWLCAVWSPMLLGVETARLPIPAKWFAEARPERRDWVAIRARQDVGLGVQRETRVAVDGNLARRGERRPGPDEYAAVRVQAGWPLLCLQGTMYHGRVDHTWRLNAAVRAPRSVRSLTRVMPVQPMLGAFLANTTIFALAVWASFAGPIAMRRRSRRCHGLCVECGYPRGATPICSECGTRLA